MRAHQNIILNGKDIGDRKSRRHSNFCNEGKWNNFIKPFLPKDVEDMTFLEFGSNAGLFLRLASEYGFCDVTGIESEKRNCDVAKVYRKSLGMSYKIRHETINESYDFKSLPACDYALLANFHYHLGVSTFLYLLDSLRNKARYIIVVSAQTKQPHQRPNSDVDSVRHYFRDFKEIDYIPELPLEGDPHPRRMFSLLFKTEIERLPIESLGKRDFKENISVKKASDEFATRVLSGGLDVRKTKAFGITSRLHEDWDESEVLAFLEDKKALIRDIEKRGLKEPIIVSNGVLLDGGHRVLAAKTLGRKTILAREL